LIALKQKTHADNDAAVELLRDKLRLIEDRIYVRLSCLCMSSLANVGQRVQELSHAEGRLPRTRSAGSAGSPPAAAAGSGSDERAQESTLLVPRLRERSMSTF